jgi:hypothetical protein
MMLKTLEADSALDLHYCVLIVLLRSVYYITGL